MIRIATLSSKCRKYQAFTMSLEVSLRIRIHYSYRWTGRPWIFIFRFVENRREKSCRTRVYIVYRRNEGRGSAGHGDWEKNY